MQKGFLESSFEKCLLLCLKRVFGLSITGFVEVSLGLGCF